MIVPLAVDEAQEWITQFCGQVVGLESMARQIREFASQNLTEESRQSANLIQGKDAEGNLVTWSSEQLTKTVRAFDTAALFVEMLARKGADGKPLLSAFQGQIRPIGGPQRRQMPQ